MKLRLARFAVGPRSGAAHLAVGVWLAACGSSPQGTEDLADAATNVPPEASDDGASDGWASDDGTADAPGEREPDGTMGDSDAGPAEEGGIPRCSPLPDGKGGLELKTSGGLALDVHLGNDDACNTSWMSMGGLLITFFVPVTGEDGGALPSAILSINIPAAQPDTVTTGTAASVDFLSSGHVWQSADVCVADISRNESVDGGSVDEVAGSLSCSGPLPEVTGKEALTIGKLAFVVAATPSP